MHIVVRDARTGDLPALHRLIGQLVDAPDLAAFRDRLQRVQASDGHRLIVAERDSTVVGIVHVFERPALEKPCEAVVQALVVDETERSGGIGETLMRAAEAWAQSRGLGAVALYSRIDRERARAFYERLGFCLKATSHLLGKSRA